jgi:hypothetical protein
VTDQRLAVCFVTYVGGRTNCQPAQSPARPCDTAFPPDATTLDGQCQCDDATARGEVCDRAACHCGTVRHRPYQLLQEGDGCVDKAMRERDDTCTSGGAMPQPTEGDCGRRDKDVKDIAVDRPEKKMGKCQSAQTNPVSAVPARNVRLAVRFTPAPRW